METVSNNNNNNNNVLSFFKREGYFGPHNHNSVLPVSSNSDTSKCRDFDFNKSNCLWQVNATPKKIQYAKIHPFVPKKDVDYIAITIKPLDDDSVCICDMV
jgi:hypothetical protein